MYTLTNPNASKEARALMDYLGSIAGEKVLSAQHTRPRIPWSCGTCKP